MKCDRPAKEYQDHRDIHRIARKAIQPDDNELLGRRPGREGTAARHVEISNGPQQQDHSHCEWKKPKWIERVRGSGRKPQQGTANATMPGSSRTATRARQNRPEVPLFLCDTFRPVRRVSCLPGGRPRAGRSRKGVCHRHRFAETHCRPLREDAPVPRPEQQVPVAADDAGFGVEPLALRSRRRGCCQRAPGGTELAVGGTGTMRVVRQSMAFAKSCASMAGIPSIRNPISPTLARSRPAGIRTSGIGPCIRLAVCPAASNSVTTIGAIRITAASPSRSSGTSRSRMPSASSIWRNRVVSAVTRAAWRPCTDIVVRTAPFGRNPGNTTANPARVLAASGVSTLVAPPSSRICTRSPIRCGRSRLSARVSAASGSDGMATKLTSRKSERNESANVCTDGSVSAKPIAAAVARAAATFVNGRSNAARNSRPTAAADARPGD